MHAIKVLEEDHARLEALLNELVEADRAARTGLSERFAKELDRFEFFAVMNELVDLTDLQSLSSER